MSGQIRDTSRFTEIPNTIRNFTRLSYVEATTANMRRLAGLVEVASTKYQNKSKCHAPNISRLAETPNNLTKLSGPVETCQNVLIAVYVL